MSGGQVAITVKATRLCNLRCSYCHDWRSGAGHTMSFEVLANLIHAACADPTHQVIGFGWHGGEPMVLPVSFYENALALQARYQRPGQHIHNRLQTNATLVTDEWARFLVREGFGVGVSIDGPPDIHDRTRVDIAGRGSFDQVLDGLGRLRHHGLDPGVLMTVGRDTVERGAEKTLEFLLSIGARKIGFNPVQPSEHLPAGQAGDDFLPRADMNRFLIDVHRCLLELDDPTVTVRELKSLMLRMTSDEYSTCILGGDCTSTFYAIEPNGDVANCDRFHGHEHYAFGSIMRSDFAQIRRSVNRRLRQAADREVAAPRQECRHFAVCSGGCPQQTGLERRHDPAHDDACCGRAPLIDYLADHLARQPEASREPGVPDRAAGAAVAVSLGRR